MLAGTTFILLLITTSVVLPHLDELVSVRPVALGMIRGSPPKLDKVAVLHLPREFEYGLDYYFQKALPEWTPEKKDVTLVFSGKQGLEQLALLPQFNHVARKKLFKPLDPSGRVFVVDLTLAESPGN